MKYGKYMQDQAVSEWQSHYFNYKRLKKEIKKLTDIMRLDQPIARMSGGGGHRRKKRRKRRGNEERL